MSAASNAIAGGSAFGPHVGLAGCALPWNEIANLRPEVSGLYQGRAGHSYRFLALATDNAGNQEQPPPGAVAPPDGAGADLGALPDLMQTPPTHSRFSTSATRLPDLAA